MKTIEFEIRGICPMKQDNPEFVMGEKQPKSDEGYIRQAEKKIYTNEKGEISIPAKALKACIKNASSEIGKKMESKKRRQNVQAFLFFDTEYLSLGTKKHDGIVKDLVTRGKGDKVTRVFAYRPIIKEWAASGKMQLMDGELQQDDVKQYMELGGIKFGLLSHRPEFGRFVVTKFKEGN